MVTAYRHDTPRSIRRILFKKSSKPAHRISHFVPFVLCRWRTALWHQCSIKHYRIAAAPIYSCISADIAHLHLDAPIVSDLAKRNDHSQKNHRRAVHYRWFYLSCALIPPAIFPSLTGGIIFLDMGLLHMQFS